MSNGKNQKKTGIAVWIVIASFIVLYFLGINIYDITLGPSDESNETIGTTETTTQMPEMANPSGELTLTMIDVGQADSFLLVQDGKTMLVDCGTRSTGEDVVKYLNEQGITRLDYVIGTHPHDDHMGGMYDVITNFEIGKIIMPEVEVGKVTTNWYVKLMQEIKQGAYELEYAKLGAVYDLGEASFKIIGPIENDESNLNNYSIVLKVTFGDMDVIMTGDAETKVEKAIIESGETLGAEILKVGHHGSDTSSSDEFLDAVSPIYALISAKVGNKYEHPIKSTMQKLEKRKIEVYRTDENGTVVATITAHDVKFSTAPGDYLSGTELEEAKNKWKATHQ